MKKKIKRIFVTTRKCMGVFGQQTIIPPMEFGGGVPCVLSPPRVC